MEDSYLQPAVFSRSRIEPCHLTIQQSEVYLEQRSLKFYLIVNERKILQLTGNMSTLSYFTFKMFTSS